MAFERTRIKITIEHGKVDVRGIQHQFHGDERGQQVASREKAVNTGKHHHRTQYQIIKSIYFHNSVCLINVYAQS